MARKSELVLTLEAEVARLTRALLASEAREQLLVSQATQRTDSRQRWEDFRSAVIQSEHIIGAEVAAVRRAHDRLAREPGEPGAYGK